MRNERMRKTQISAAILTFAMLFNPESSFGGAEHLGENDHKLAISAAIFEANKKVRHYDGPVSQRMGLFS